MGVERTSSAKTWAAVALTPVLTLSLGLARPALAQRPETKQEKAKDARGRAIELFKQSEVAYRDGRFEDAAELLREAYALDPAPTLLYNRARALESAGDLEGAKNTYQAYLDQDPKTPDRAAIERRIANLTQQLAEKKALEEKARAVVTPPPPPPVAPPQVVAPAPPPEGPGLVPWAIAGAGGAVVITGGILGIMAKGKHGDAVDAATQIEADNLDGSARGLALGANISYGVGGLMIVGGVIWGLVGGKKQPVAYLTSDGQSVGLAGRW